MAGLQRSASGLTRPSTSPLALATTMPQFRTAPVPHDAHGSPPMLTTDIAYKDRGMCCISLPTTCQAAHRSEHAQPAPTSRCAKGIGYPTLFWAHTPGVRNTMACCSRERN